MIIPGNWLKEHLLTKHELKTLIEALTKLGLPCDKFFFHQCWNEVEIVKIINIEKHPNADNLNICTIENSKKEQFAIICGDKTLQSGYYVPFAASGTQLPEVLIKKAKIRGMESAGMLCSAKEIGLPINKSGVLTCFEEDFGKTIAAAYEKEGIFSIELTPNRGDALSIRGIARILAQENYGELKPLDLKNIQASEGKLFEIESSDCFALEAASFEYILKPTNPMIFKKLQLINFEPTNIDLIDLTNYISHEIGQPMHVFDYEKINGIPSITNLKNPTKFKALNEKELILNSSTLVIKTDEIISWPGIIGAQNSKVTNQTKKILVETGCFQIDALQRRQNKIITESAKRFEYGSDIYGPENAMKLFFKYLEIMPTQIQSKKFEDTKKIKFDFANIKKILGLEISFEEFKKEMENKDFKFEDEYIIIPSYKYFEIKTQNCIVEEFARNKYENLQSINLVPKIPKRKIRNEFREIFLNDGFFECYNISITAPENNNFKIDQKFRKILNPSYNSYSILRGTLIPGLLKNLEWHKKNNYKEDSFFEIGLIYGQYENKQKNILTAISTSYEKLSVTLSKILSNFEISYSENLVPWQESGAIYENFAKIGLIKKSILAEYELENIYALELDLENTPLAKKHKSPTGIMPIYKDITFTLPVNATYGKLANELHKYGYNFEPTDIYPNNILETERKITIKFKIEKEKTLTKEEIQEFINEILEKMKKEMKFES